MLLYIYPKVLVAIVFGMFYVAYYFYFLFQGFL